MTIVKSKHASNYTVLPNELFKSGLSLEAIGLLSYFLSLPHDWVIYKTQLYTQLNVGREKIDRVFKELQKKGYVISVKQIGEKGRFEYSHIVYDKPFNGEPHTALPPTAEQPLLNKEGLSTKKENNIFGDTTDSSNDSVLWQEENNQIPPNPKPDLPPKKPKGERKTPNTVHHKCVDFYCTEFRPIGWGKFTSKDGAKVKTLIEKITKTLIDYKIEPTDETILEKFKSLMLNLPDFYKNQDLSTIDSKYHVIFNELKSKGNQSIIKENKPWLRPNLTVEEQMALTTEQKNEWARVILNVNI
jgi:hypothetical protein